VLSRLLYGARVSLGVAGASVLISTLLGTLVGSAAGYLGGLADRAAMRTADLFLSFPRIVLLVVAAAVLSPSIWTVVLLLGLTGWMGTARLVRSEVLSLREREFVLAARAVGAGGGRLLFRHVLPNALPPVLVASALAAADAILAEAALSFLGLGVQPPTPSWGGMIADGRAAPLRTWWMIVLPGAAISLAVVAFNLSSEDLRVRLRPGGGES
jgi:peptide/nickel transport system permease protein